jgi:hypothetical protein
MSENTRLRTQQALALVALAGLYYGLFLLVLPGVKALYAQHMETPYRRMGWTR